MKNAKKGMEAVIAKTSKRKPALKRKGPGIAIMIAVGKPKPGMGMGKGEMQGKGEMAEDKPKTRLAALEARIAELEAQLAEMGGEDEAEDEDED